MSASVILGPKNGAHVEADWAVWRLVLSKVATLSELDVHYSVDDLVLANYALTYQQACEESG